MGESDPFSAIHLEEGVDFLLVVPPSLVNLWVSSLPCQSAHTEYSLLVDELRLSLPFYQVLSVPTTQVVCGPLGS